VPHFARFLNFSETSLQQSDTMIDEPAVGLELRFSRPAHADTAAEFLEVTPHSLEAR
jgi:hypothetical protein